MRSGPSEDSADAGRRRSHFASENSETLFPGMELAGLTPNGTGSALDEQRRVQVELLRLKLERERGLSVPASEVRLLLDGLGAELRRSAEEASRRWGADGRRLFEDLLRSVAALAERVSSGGE